MEVAEVTYQLMAATGTGTAAWLRAGEELGHPALAAVNETLVADRPFALIKIHGRKSRVPTPSLKFGIRYRQMCSVTGDRVTQLRGLHALTHVSTATPLRPSHGTMAWNPAKYLTFGQARLRPALDLLAQARAVAPASAARVVVSVPGAALDAAPVAVRRAARECDADHVVTGTCL